MKANNRKIPGFLPPPPKTELDGKLSDLSSKPLHELLELRDRQEKLLQNTRFIMKLDDNGQKIRSLLDRIEFEINFNRQKVQKYEKVRKNIRQWNEAKRRMDPENWFEYEYFKGKDLLNKLSWAAAKSNNVGVNPPEKPLITPEDLEEIDEKTHTQYIVDKTENKSNVKTKESFKPYKSTVTNVHDSSKEVLRKKHKYWENTSATPPPMLHAPAKMLTIEESLALQREHNIHLKEVEARHAAEKLAATRGIKLGDIPQAGSSFMGYRDVDSDNYSESDPEGSDKEVHDEEPDRGGGVVFTVMK